MLPRFRVSTGSPREPVPYFSLRNLTGFLGRQEGQRREVREEGHVWYGAERVRRWERWTSDPDLVGRGWRHKRMEKIEKKDNYNIYKSWLYFPYLLLF